MNTNKLLHKIPFLRFFVPFSLGIITCHFLQPSKSIFSEVLFFYSLLSGVYFLLFKQNTSVFKLFFGLLVNVLFFSIGIQSVFIHQPKNKSNHYTNFTLTDNTLFKGYVKDIPKKSGNRFIKTTISLHHIFSGNKWQRCSGDLMIYLPSSDSMVEIGNFINFNNHIIEIPKPKNPYEFNYKDYLSTKGIYHQVYLKSTEYQVYENPSELPFVLYADQLKNYLIKVLKNNGLTGDQLAITSALLLGYDDEISRELLNAYSATGTLHVLSVSGLHVGIVFFILNFLIRFPNNKLYNFIKGIVMLACIWFYAALTGLSPSVIRSASMFSFIIFGTLISRKGNIYNTLLASAFIILLFNPNLIFDIGFQLSYIAVAGIVFFYPYIDNWYNPDNKWIKKLWQTTAISISAQISTLPISLFYFGQFPVLFFISNLIIIPISYIVMFGAMFLVCISPIKCLASIITWLLSFSVKLMNEITLFLDGFSYLNISDAKIGLTESLLLFFFIVVVTHFLIKKNYNSGIISLVTLIILFSFSIKSQFNVKDKLTVYHIKGETGIDLFQDGISYSYSISENDKSKFNEIAKQNRILNNIKKTVPKKLDRGFYFIKSTNKKIGILVNDTLMNYDVESLSLDYLILTKNPFLKGIDAKLADQFILDGNNDFKTRKYIEKKQITNFKNTYDGAYIEEL